MTSGRVVFVLGPTAVGKSQFATDLAEETHGAILNCDSVQAFQKVSIGAAKPDAATRARVPHLLLDWVPPLEEFNASVFREQALAQLAEWTKKGPVFAVGGSGFYVRALCRGTFNVRSVPPERANYWRLRAMSEGSQELHRILEKQDPKYAARVSSNDAYRIARALGLMEVEKRTMTEIRHEFDQRPNVLPYRYIKIGFKRTRESLRERIRLRCEQMLREGWREEVEALLKEGLRDWQPLKSVGYREMVQAIEGELPWDQLKDAVINSTLRLAKKQMTWFKADPEVQWFEAGQEDERAALIVRDFLLGN